MTAPEQTNHLSQNKVLSAIFLVVKTTWEHDPAVDRSIQRIIS